jgi:CRP-like cAMP-binding protein
MINEKPEISDVDNQLILSSNIFRGVSVRDLMQLIAESELITVFAYQTLIQFDTKNVYFYVVLDGSLNVYLENSINEHYISLIPGDCAGELSILDGGYTSARVVAASDSRLLRINEETLWRLVMASHGFARNLLFLLAKRIRKDNVAIIDGIRWQHEWN